MIYSSSCQVYIQIDSITYCTMQEQNLVQLVGCRKKTATWLPQSTMACVEADLCVEVLETALDLFL